jgi:hypothetical protein
LMDPTTLSFERSDRPPSTHTGAAMKHCRTQASLKMQVKCPRCAHRILVPHSCGHRH